jgi:PERQ amino acid-rich with GYF domain-containing protein
MVGRAKAHGQAAGLSASAVQDWLAISVTGYLTPPCEVATDITTSFIQMSQASMQFAPQWLKSTRGQPAGTQQPQQSGPRPATPPLLSPSIVTPPAVNTGISYSHMANPSSARAESFPSDGLLNGHGAALGSAGSNGVVMDQVRPFRYSKEIMLSLYDPGLVKSRPLELLELAEGGGVVLSEKPNVPFGLTEWTEDEKKVRVCGAAK